MELNVKLSGLALFCDNIFRGELQPSMELLLSILGVHVFVLLFMSNFTPDTNLNLPVIFIYH